MGGAADVILYDGVCGLCNRLNQFVLRRDADGKFRFASLQSAFACQVLARHGKDPRDLDTLYLIVDHEGASERLLSKSGAALHVLRRLGGVWSLARFFGLLPTRLRDRGYDLVARHRYRMLGRYDACLVPGPEHRRRFIEV